MKVTVAKFSYDKGNGEAPKDRQLLVLSKPTDSYFGVEFDDIKEVQPYIKYLEEKQVLELYLQAKYGLVDANYKRFKQAKIAKLTESAVSV